MFAGEIELTAYGGIHLRMIAYDNTWLFRQVFLADYLDMRVKEPHPEFDKLVYRSLEFHSALQFAS